MRGAVPRGAREIWGDRAGAPTGKDRAYLVYLVVVTLLVIGVPAARVAVRALSRPDVLAMLLDPRAPDLALALWLAGCAVLVVAGSVRGPAVLTPFFTVTLAGTDAPRRRVLARPYGRSVLALAAVGTGAAALAGGVLLGAGRLAPGGAALLCGAVLGASLLAAGAWLAGEVAEPAARRILAGLLAGAALAAALVAERAPGIAGPGVAMGLAASGLAVTPISVLALDRIRGAVLLEQAQRWESATMVATSGDVAAAAGHLRALPTAGRRLRAVRPPRRPGPRGLLGLYLRRDAVALLRTPERTAVGVLAVLVGAAALAGSVHAAGAAEVPLVAVGALLCWGGSGALVDGVRHGIATLGSPVLFGQSAGTQVLLHAVAPALALLLLAALGGVPWGGAVALPLLLVLVLLVGRVRDAAKGPMPPELTMPIPTAQGDLSVLRILAWQGDAVLLALASGAALAIGQQFGGAAGLLLAAGIAVAVMAAGAAMRLRALRDRS